VLLWILARANLPRHLLRSVAWNNGNGTDSPRRVGSENRYGLARAGGASECQSIEVKDIGDEFQADGKRTVTEKRA
jgi:hypothetical protein